jgi:hypothetical protein
MRALRRGCTAAGSTPSPAVCSRHGPERYTDSKVLYIAHHCRVDRWGKITFVRCTSPTIAQYTEQYLRVHISPLTCLLCRRAGSKMIRWAELNIRRIKIPCDQQVELESTRGTAEDTTLRAQSRSQGELDAEAREENGPSRLISRRTCPPAGCTDVPLQSWPLQACCRQ